jgi:LacI family transcriptional regulator
VPGDISLVGFDDTEEALLVDPPLTTVRVPKEAIGQACVELLMQREIHPGDPFICRLLPTELIIRGTVHRL